MTTEELVRLRTELVALGERYKTEFEEWYDMANLIRVNQYCFIGWLVERKLEDPPKADEPAPKKFKSDERRLY